MNCLFDVAKTLSYTPYRGKVEPVTRFGIAKIILYPNFIEIRVAYDYMRNIEMTMGYRK